PIGPLPTIEGSSSRRLHRRSRPRGRAPAIHQLGEVSGFAGVAARVARRPASSLASVLTKPTIEVTPIRASRFFPAPARVGDRRRSGQRPSPHAVNIIYTREHENTLVSSNY